MAEPSQSHGNLLLGIDGEEISAFTCVEGKGHPRINRTIILTEHSAQPRANAASMPDLILALDDLPARFGRIARLMGVDLGTKTIGLALSDVERRIATPLETIRRTKFAADSAG